MCSTVVLACEQVTLLDSLRKRCEFVESATKQVGLGNVQVVWARAEEAGQNLQHREVDMPATLPQNSSLVSAAMHKYSV